MKQIKHLKGADPDDGQSLFIVMEILCTLIATRLERPMSPTTAPEHVVSIRRIWEDEKL